MAYVKRPLGLFFLLLMIIMGAQVALKRPLCINSNFVYKIDKIDTLNTETIYNCKQYKKVIFSNFFYNNLPALQAQFNNIEVMLAQLGATNKFIIVIDDNNKNQTQVLANGVQIGSDLLTTGHLEKMLIEQSLKNKLNSNKLNTQNQIFLQTFSDFLISDGNYQNLVSEAWGESFKELGFFAKRKITKLLIQNLLQNNRVFTNDSEEIIGKLKSLLATSANTELVESFNKSLKKLGYYSASDLAELKLDVVIERDDLQSVDAELLSLAKDHPYLKIAVKNTVGMYLLPSNLKIPSVLEQNIFTKYRLIFDSRKENKTVIAHYINNTESLVLIRSGSELNKMNLHPLFASGIKEFLFLNKQADFIQIHLPSYKLKYKDLGRIANYFDFVRIKKLSKHEHVTLGWSHTEWLKDLRAFRPIANYDVIQYFRIN